jgi:RNA 2',3'-cyclic 3'-phosphodiesterase
LFFALWPDHALQTALADVTQDVVSASGGRAVPPENFHITLAFLGSVPEPSVAKVEAVGAQVAAETEQAGVQLTLDAIEYWKKAKVVCATARVPQNAGARFADTLSTLLKSRLTAAGFTPDLRSLWSVGSRQIQEFRPHVTLARKATHPIHRTGIQPVFWTFTDFALVDSRTERNGSVYTVLQTFSLGVRKSSPHLA